MLSDTQKELIRAEEVYRQEVRREVETQPPPPSKARQFFAFLNTGVGLFLLSTFFVSGFSWAYGEIAQSREKKARAEATAQNLKLEILNRLETIHRLETRFRAEHQSVIRSAIFGFQTGNTNPSWKHFYSPIIPEYRERSLVSLLWQLEAESRTDERTKIADLRRRAASLEDYFDKLVYSEEPSNGHTPDKVPLQFWSLPAEDCRHLRQEVLVPFAALRVSMR